MMADYDSTSARFYFYACAFPLFLFKIFFQSFIKSFPLYYFKTACKDMSKTLQTQTSATPTSAIKQLQLTCLQTLNCKLSQRMFSRGDIYISSSIVILYIHTWTIELVKIQAGFHHTGRSDQSIQSLSENSKDIARTPV